MKTKFLIILFFQIYSNVFSIPIIEKLDFESLGIKNNYQVPITSFNGKNIAIGTNKLKDSNLIISTDYGKSWKLSKIDTIGSYRSENNSLFELHFVDESTLVSVLANNVDSSWTVNGQNYKTSYQIGFILKSTDFGKSWKEQIIDYKHAMFYLRMPTSNYGTFRQYTNYLYTNNCWESWKENTYPGWKYNYQYIYQVLCPKEFTHLIVAKANNEVVKVFKSENEGLTWDSTLVLPGHANKILYNNENDILAFYNSANFFRTYDYGKNWAKIEVKSDTLLQNIQDLLMLNNERFVALTQNYIIYSNDNWKTSELIDFPQLEKSETLSKIIKIDENKVFVCTYFGDIYSIKFDEVGVKENIQNKSNLYSIYPNPATDYIVVDIREKGLSPLQAIEIFDIFGNEIHPPRLASQATPQVGNLKLDVSTLPAGVYFVRIGNEKPMKFVKL